METSAFNWIARIKPSARIVNSVAGSSARAQYRALRATKRNSVSHRLICRRAAAALSCQRTFM